MKIKNRERRERLTAEQLHAEARRAALKHLYGLTPADYDRMLIAQGGVCGLCGTDMPGGPRSRGSFAVDHDHTTGRVRGLLCFACNVQVGVLEHYLDDRELLDRVLAWLAGPDQRSIRSLFDLEDEREGCAEGGGA